MKTLICTIYLLLIFASANAGYTLMKPQPQWQSSFENLTVHDGLLSNTVYDIEQDALGFMWFATDRGLSKYDGLHFENISAESLGNDSCIYRLAKSESGEIWFISSMNNVYKIENYKPRLIVGSEKIGEPSVTDLLLDFRIVEDTLIDVSFRHTNWLRYDDKGTEVLAPGGINGKNLYFDNHGAFSYNVYPEGEEDFNATILYIHHGGRTDGVQTKPNNRASVSSVIENGDIVVANNYEMFLLSFETKQILRKEVFERKINCIGRNNNSEIWIGCYKEGVLTFDTTSFKTVLEKQFFKGQSISNILVNLESEIWVATLGSGVYLQFNSTLDVRNIFQSAVEVAVTKQFRLKDQILFMRDDWTLLKYNISIDRWSYINLQSEIELSDVVSVHDVESGFLVVTDRGNILLVEENGKVSKVHDRGGSYVKKAFLINNHTLKLVASRCNRYYNLKTNKITIDGHKYNTHRFYFVDGRNDLQSADPHFSDFSVDDKISIINKSTTSHSRISHIVPVAAFNSLVVTDNGFVFQWNCKEKLLTYKCKSSWLTHIYDIVIKDSSDLHFLTDRGLLRLTYDRNHVQTRFTDLSRILPLGNVKAMSVVNEKIIGITNGKIFCINYCEDETIAGLKRPIPRYIIRNGEKSEIKSFGSLNVSKIDKTAIEFTSFVYPSNKGIKFRYKTPLSTDWRMLEGNKLDLSNFKSGFHRIEISSGYGNIEWSPVFTMDLEIKPANIWNRMMWFSVPAGITIVFLIFLKVMFIMNVHFIIHRQRLLRAESSALKAQVNTHFMFNTLNSIQHLVATNNTNEAIEGIAKFSSFIRNTLENSRSEFVFLNRELNSLSAYLKLEANRLRSKFNFRITVNEGVDINSIQIPPMLIQPFVENAVLHGVAKCSGNSGMILLDFNVVGNTLIVVVQDNGVGRGEVNMNQEKKSSFGMEITDDRLAVLFRSSGKKGDYKITDLYNNGRPCGTKVTINIPYKTSKS